MSEASHLATWNAYQSAWSAIPDRERLERSVAPGCLYADPQTELEGLDALVAKIEQSQAATPGASFRNDQLTTFGDEALSEWTMYGPDGFALVQGASYARYGDDGRLTHMSGFFKRPDAKDLSEPKTPAARSWDLYQAAWARISADQRRTLLATAVDEAAVYADPKGRRRGVADLGDYITAAQEAGPGAWFRQTLFIAHHGQALSRWERLSPDGDRSVGASYARFASDGRVLQMTGFPGSKPRAT